MSYIRQTIRDAAYTLAPKAVVRRYLRDKMLRQARGLRMASNAAQDYSLLLEKVWSTDFFRPLQKQSEILRLTQALSGFRPSTICEIGAAGGGTTFLFAQAAESDATIITLDLAFSDARQTALRSFAREGQRLFCISGDSHLDDTVKQVKSCLSDRQLDVLYLDGDHSYAGVKTDFQLYSPFVRDGGWIVLHDIVPDFGMRFGIETASDVGGVPDFWSELKGTGLANEEIIEDAEQDGFGIGILHWQTPEPTVQDKR